MQSPRLYYCHPCKKTVPISTLELLCPTCGSDFLQEAKMPELDNDSDSSGNESRPIFRVNLDNLNNHHGFFSRLLEEMGQNRPEGRSVHDFVRNFIMNFREPRYSDSESEEDEENLHIKHEIAENDEEIDCKICTVNFAQGDEKAVLVCNHQYHSQCLEPWLKIKHCCPFCRQRI
jgi:DNA-directed RNA polymerase subunit RPC12/RpoP